MTLAEAIAQVRAGEQDGFSDVISYTAPNIWLAVSLLCGREIGSTMTAVYRRAAEQGDGLHSPSDLRLWLCGIAYPLLLAKPDGVHPMTGRSDSEVFFRMLSALPREERTAVLLLCGEGCTAAQCAQILDSPEIEIKRAMRRARASLAEHAKRERIFSGDTVNTAWILKRMKELREQKAQQPELFSTITRCVQEGTDFVEESTSSAPGKTDPRNYFQKLFRTKRFS
ncbi:MAG: sigma factor-like helix-turn-helix DNA-binding protein [Eubacteriales bacterium]|nr:sigma factor-like helix-turn-helix DNA-binding protein [Eubacteriales bacterium]